MNPIDILWYSLGANALFFIVFFLAKKENIDKIKIMLGKKNGIGRAFIMSKDRTIRHTVTKIGEEMDIGKEKYIVKKEDIFIDRENGCSAVVLCQATGKSIDYTGETPTLDAQTIDIVCERMYHLGKIAMQKIITYMIIAMICIGLALIIEGYSLYNIYQLLHKLEAAGREIVLQ